MISEKMRNMVKNSSAIRAMFEEGKRLAKIYGEQNVYDFSLGNPNLPAPKEVSDALKEEIESCDALTLHGYMSNAGYDDVREEIAQNLNKKYSTRYDKNCIVMSVGAAGGLNVFLKAVLDPGDEVVVIAPFFGEYANYVANYDGRLVVVKPNPPTFQPDIKAFGEALTAKTKAVIINTPNNPTGVVYDEKTLAALADEMRAAEKKFGTTIYLLSDEPYRELVFGVNQPYPARFYENTVSGYSFSKSLSLAGERIGYLAVNPECADFEDLIGALGVATRVLGFVNAPSLIQRAVARCLDASVDVKFYEKNGAALKAIMDECGFEYVEPQGAFYLFVKAPGGDDTAFCAKAKEHRLLLVPASGFGCKGWVRIAYCVSPETIRSSRESFIRLAEDCRK